MRDGIIVTTGSSNNIKTNTLTVSNTSINDSGYYRCHATLNVSSNIISEDTVSIVTIKCKYLCINLTGFHMLNF